jgi:predicted TPR repeat methyltransferase
MKEAVDLYNRVMANARGENSIEAAYRLGSIFFNNQYEPQKEKDNKKMALAYYARLLFAGGPLAEEAAFRTAQCHEALGGIEVARAAYQGYLRRFPEGKFRADADARLRALPPPPPQP